MINDPDNADITSAPYHYQVMKQFIIRPGVNEPYNRRLQTRFHAEINLCQSRLKSIVFHAKLRRVPTAWGNDDVWINTQYVARHKD